jgi:hypothetical protein
MHTKKNKKSNSKRFHRFFGAISVLFLSVIVSTGILLMNPQWLSSDLTITTALQQDHGTWVGTQSGLYYQKKNTPTIQPVSLRYAPSKVVGIIDHPQLMVAFKESLLLKKVNALWHRIPIPQEIDELWSLTSSTQGILLTTNNGIYLYQNETWIQQLQTPQSQLLYWIKKAHTGYIGPDWVRSLFHVLSWVTMGLIMTGIILLFKK